MENLEKMCTVTTGAEGFMFEILSEKERKENHDLYSLELKLRAHYQHNLQQILH